jgi:Tfp pilus assembly protein FimT
MSRLALWFKSPVLSKRPYGFLDYAFTFVELLIITIVIGILISVGIPRFSSTFDNFRLQGFSKDIFYLARFLQASAISQGKIYYLNVDKEKQELTATCKDKDSDEWQKAPGRFGRVYKAPGNIDVKVEPEDKSGIYFYPDGSSDKVSIIFTDQYKRQVSLIAKGGVSGIKIQ